jgi:5-methylthioadenosine/S-adenosylhomocysteine deaminase
VIPADLLVAGGVVLTVDQEGSVIPDGAVAVRNGEIVAVGPVAELTSRFTAAETLDASRCLVMPGLVNTHAHLAMNLFRGEADDVSLERFLRQLLRAELVQLTAEAVAVGVEAALAECLRGGITTALDMYWYPEAASEVADRVGFRLLNGPSFMDVVDPDGRSFDRRMQWAEDLLARQRARDPAAPAWVMPHSAYMLSREQLDRVMALARRFDARIHVHAAESPGEDDAVLARHGSRPMTVLAEAGSSAPRPSWRTPCTSTTRTSRCWPAPGRRSRTARCPTCTWAAASRACRSCCGPASRWAWAPTGRPRPGPWTCSPASGWPRSCTRG